MVIIAGDAKVGEELAITELDPDISEVVYQWQRQPELNSTPWMDIEGAMEDAYLIQEADIGYNIRAVVTAEDDEDNYVTSNILGPVVAQEQLGQWIYLYNGEHRRDPFEGIGTSVDFNIAMVYSPQSSGQSISGVAFHYHESSTATADITPVIYESEDIDSLGTQVIRGDMETYDQGGWYEVFFSPINLMEGKHYWIILEIDIIGSTYMGIDNGPMVQNGGLVQLESDTTWRTLESHGWNNNWLIEVFIGD